MTKKDVRWSDEECNELIELYYNGNTLSNIANSLNRSRSSIASKIYTLGIKREVCNINYIIRKRKVAKYNISTCSKSYGDKKYSLLELKDNQCRWGIGDVKDKDFFFCGAKTENGAVYCPEHAKRAYITSNKEEADEN